MSRHPRLPCAACGQSTAGEWLVPVVIVGEQDTLLCDKDGCRECARCDQGIVEGEDLVRVEKGRLAHRGCLKPSDIVYATWPNMKFRDVQVRRISPEFLVEACMADEKKKRRGRVPFAERRQELMDAISRSEQHTLDLKARLAVMESEQRDKIAAMQKELEA